MFARLPLLTVADDERICPGTVHLVHGILLWLQRNFGDDLSLEVKWLSIVRPQGNTVKYKLPHNETVGFKCSVWIH